MGRTKYSPEERNRITKIFLSSTREIIEQEGVGELSIRRISHKAGFNSATLYLYFEDVDELITLACMGYLEKFCRQASQAISKLNDPCEIYRRVWEIFCREAFTKPKIFYRLYFYPHSSSLEHTVKRYYEIYPDQLPPCATPIQSMLVHGGLLERNWPLLQEAARVLRIPEDQAQIINHLTVYHFKELLQQAAQTDHTDVEARSKQQMDAIRLLMEQYKENA